jgi:hypothetical protein
LLSCEYAKWFLIIHSIKTKLLESSHGVWVFSSSFLGVWLPFYGITWISRICLFGQTPIWFLSRTKKFEFPKIICEQVRSCIILEGKGNILVVSWVKVMLSVLLAWNNKKQWRHIMNTRKHMILLIKQGLWTKKVLRHEQVMDKTKRGWNQNKKKFYRYDQTEVVISVHNKNRLHSPTLVKFPLDQPSYDSFCRNTGLCWGFWPCLPLISSSQVVVGV